MTEGGRSDDPASATVDRAVLQQFWDQRTAIASDPRSVTLDPESPARVARHVRRYQSWLFRNLTALGCVPRRIADLGCGNGDWTVRFAEGADEVVAVDFAAGFLDHCRDRLTRDGLADRVTLVQADLGSFQFPGGGFDLIVLGSVTQYLNDDEVIGLLTRARAALAPGGVLYFRTAIAKHLDRIANHTADYSAIYRSAGWHRQVIGQAGFHIQRESTATDFIAHELAYGALGEHALSRIFVAWPLMAIRRLYRHWRAKDVFVCLARGSS